MTEGTQKLRDRFRSAIESADISIQGWSDNIDDMIPMSYLKGYMDARLDLVCDSEDQEKIRQEYLKIWQYDVIWNIFDGEFIRNNELKEIDFKENRSKEELLKNMSQAIAVIFNDQEFRCHPNTAIFLQKVQLDYVGRFKDEEFFKKYAHSSLIHSGIILY